MERRRFQVRGTKLFRIVLLLLTFVCVGTACGRGEEVSSETTAETVTAVHTTVQTEQSVPYSVQTTSVQTTSVPPQTALSVPAQSEPQIIADGFSAAVLSLPQGYRLHASADIANKPYRTAEGSLVLSVKRADEADLARQPQRRGTWRNLGGSPPARCGKRRGHLILDRFLRSPFRHPREELRLSDRPDGRIYRRRPRFPTVPHGVFCGIAVV